MYIGMATGIDPDPEILKILKSNPAIRDEVNRAIQLAEAEARAN